MMIHTQPNNDTGSKNSAHAWTRLLHEAVNTPGLMLRAYEAFHDYSIGNQILAACQCAERGLPLGAIATYQQWLAKGRQVRRGERALTLCAPITFKSRNGDSEARRTGFVMKNRWFVLAQTEGDELPPVTIPEWNAGRALFALNVTETPYEATDGNCQGYARDREISINPLAELPHKTRFHELAHIILGHTAEKELETEARTPRALREAEAEAVALICLEVLKLDGAEYCRGYIQNWLEGASIPEQSAQRIFRAADQIIKAGAPEKESKENEH